MDPRPTAECTDPRDYLAAAEERDDTCRKTRLTHLTSSYHANEDDDTHQRPLYNEDGTPFYQKTDISALLVDRQQRCLAHVKRFGTDSSSIRRCFVGHDGGGNNTNEDANEDYAHTFDYQHDLLKVQAPMVRCSRPPFRKLCRLWGTDISYTHMILADCFVRSESARQVDFALFEGEDRLITQFAAKCGPTLAEAAAIVSRYTDGIDINCGCPQKWAMKDGYGSALLEKPELVADMVSCVANSGAGVPCVVKMRVYDNLQTSVEFARRAEKAGAAWLTVHGRTPQCTSGAAVRHSAIQLIRESVSIPVVANGGVRDPESSIRLALEAGVGGVMSGQGLLDNPATFDKATSCFAEVVNRRWGAMPVLGAAYKQQQREAMAAGVGIVDVDANGNQHEVTGAPPPASSSPTEGTTEKNSTSFWRDCYDGHFSLSSHPNSMPAKDEGAAAPSPRRPVNYSALADVPPIACISDFCRLSLHTELPYKTTQHHLLMMAHKLMSPAERIYVSEQPSIAGIVEYMRQQGLYVPDGRYHH